MKTPAEKTEALIAIFPKMATTKACVRALFEIEARFTGSEGFGYQKRAYMKTACKVAGVTLNEGWAIAEAFMDLITDERYLDLIHG
jgi:hypothetical protein